MKHIPNTENRVENTTRFGNRMKQCHITSVLHIFLIETKNPC